MLATLLSAAITFVATLLLGQGVLWLLGRRTWSWLAVPVGLSVLMLLAVPALHVPGRTTTTGVVIAVLCAAALVLLVREPAARPPLTGLLAAVPPFVLSLVPFMVAGRSGTLGVSFSNDMSAHLALADAHLSTTLEHYAGDNYPLGPHAVVASIAGLLDLPTDQVFAGFTIVLPTLVGLTALATLRRVGLLGQAFVAFVAGTPFLLVAYVGEGAFKEGVLASLLIGTAVMLGRQREARGLVRWIPLGLVAAGVVSVYSYLGLVWPGAFLVGWLVVLAAGEVERGGAVVRRAGASVRAELPALALGTSVALVVLAPQWGRILNYYSGAGGGTGLKETDLGNLIGRLPFWEAFGVWDVADFRMAAHDPLATGVWSALVAVLVVWGATWWVRRGDWMLPLAAAMAAIVWLVADRTSSPYAAAKGLVLLAPLVMLVAARPLAERAGWRPRAVPAWWAIGAPVIAIVLLVKTFGSSWDGLRHSIVGPRTHMLELRELRGFLHGQPVLFLGNDDFIRWELEPSRVYAPFIGAPTDPIRAEKAWDYGEAFDIDSVSPELVNTVRWVILPRDPVGSDLPRQLRLVRATKSYALYRREGRMPFRRLLAEGEGPAAILDCKRDPRARRIARSGGTAAIRPGGVAVSGLVLGAGGDRVITLPLPAGRWSIVAQYTSGLPFTVSAPQLPAVRMPANLDRPGPRFLVGRVDLPAPAAVPLRVHVDRHRFASTAPPAAISAVIATPDRPDRTVPLRKACGKNVDYYLPSG
jgi:hypothetical protein